MSQVQMGACETLRNTHVASYRGIKTPRRPKGGEKNWGISDPQYMEVGVEGGGGGQELYEQGLTLFIEFQLVHPYDFKTPWNLSFQVASTCQRIP